MSIFTEEQLKILDQIEPYIDFQLKDERKGSAEGWPLLQVYFSDSYWCVVEDEMKVVPEEMVGAYIVEENTPYSYEWDYVRDWDWKKAEYKEVTEMQWVAAKGETNDN